jgi:hypothetical protein
MRPILIFILSITFYLVQAQATFELKGTVNSEDSVTPLWGATLWISSLKTGVSTDSSGQFLFKLPPGMYNLQVSYLGFIDQQVKVNLDHNRNIEIKMLPRAIQVDEVVVQGERAGENLLITVEIISIDRQAIEKLPAFLGQPDPLKTIQLMPGVSSAGEGNTGIYVRGGAIDQNLIHFDGAPVYHTGHLFGFFSLFNSAAVEKIDLIKGGIPASHGGRLSSVLGVIGKSGNLEKWKGEGSIGIIAGNLAIEGPLVKNKASILFTARRTYLDQVSKWFTSDNTIFNTGIDYYFSDFNAKLDLRLSPHNRITITGFSGVDDFLFDGNNNMQNTIYWKNQLASLQWDHYFNPQLSSRTNLFFSKYQMQFGADINNYQFGIFSEIVDQGFRTELNWLAGESLELQTGLEIVQHRILPNQIKANASEVELLFSPQEKLFGLEAAGFVSAEWNAAPELKISAGLRLSGYQQLGPWTSFQTDPALQVLDTMKYAKGTVIQQYLNPEPRISISWNYQENASFKASFDKTNQYIHMAPVSSISLPTDIWVPSSAKIKPQSGYQYSLGYHRNFNQNIWETSIVLYYKNMDNQIEYRDGVIVGYSKGYNFDDNFIFGKGRSYGAEFLLKKRSGRLQGWLAYTLAKTGRSFPEINQGRYFPAKYDRTHDLALVGSFELNPKWDFSGVLVYATGNAMTLPVGRYVIEGNVINEYQGRNTFRMPSYHRMDLSATYHHVRRKNFESEWVFSIYNVYNRKNPYYIFFDTSGNLHDYELKVTPQSVSLFPFLPSVSYNFKF